MCFAQNVQPQITHKKKQIWEPFHPDCFTIKHGTNRWLQKTTTTSSPSTANFGASRILLFWFLIRCACRTTKKQGFPWRRRPIMIDDPTNQGEKDRITWKSIVITSGLSDGINGWGSENLHGQICILHFRCASKWGFKKETIETMTSPKKKGLAVYHFETNHPTSPFHQESLPRRSEQNIYEIDPSSTLTLLGCLCLF